MASSTTLRVITNRLTTTPVNELPYVVSFLASSLSDCAEFNPQSRTGKTNAANANEAVQINKLKARLTSLLQDRSVEGRWASVVLIKALLEAGGWDALRDCGPWVRGLLANLTKPNPTSTKTLSIITLSRIFQLTYQYPSLVREITTPNLPGFITACLNLVSAQKAVSSGITRTESSLLEIVLAAFAGLIGRHPTVFRPFVGQLRKLAVPILASTSQNSPSSTNVLRLAQQVFVSLHNCAPKNTAAEQWANDCKKTVSAIHQAADHVFRSVVEQWESADPNHRLRKRSKDVSDSPQADEPDALDLPSWQGVLSGTNRIRTLLELLNQFLSVRTASTINYPLGAILNLTSRLTSVTVPKVGEENTQANSEFSRDERASLFMELPRIHTACIELFRSIISTFESGSLSVILTILEQTLWLFEAESFNSSVRQSSYLLLGTILPLIGRSLPKQMVFDMSSLVRECCRDLVPTENTSSIPDQQKNSSTASASKNGQLNMNIDVVLNSSVKESNTQKDFYLEGPRAAATTLLPLLYNYLPTEYIPMSLRTEMERAAILTGNRSAMVASIMNPVLPIKGRRPIPSIVPFVSRRYAKDMQVECLMRPRMPNLPGTGTDQYDAEDFEEQEAYKEADVQPISDLGAQRLSSNIAKDSLEVSTTPASIPALRPLAQNKRLLSEDSEMTNTANVQPASVSFTENKSPESKKARLQIEETSVATKTSVPVTLSDTTTTAEIIPPPATTALLRDPESSAGTLNPVNSFPVKTANGGATSNLIDDDSDDEMPRLNLEPDTDEDEDE